MCATADSGVPTKTPCPRFKMCPLLPALRRVSRTTSSIAEGSAKSMVGSTLPCTHQSEFIKITIHDTSKKCEKCHRPRTTSCHKESESIVRWVVKGLWSLGTG